MKKILSVENMRASDAATIIGGIPGKELMYRAGRGIFEAVYGPTGFSPLNCKKTCILCGTGNNAGDGYVVAALLKEKDALVDIILAKEKFSEDGLYYYNKCREMNVNVFLWEPSIELEKYDIIIDCLLGTGFKGAPRGEIREIIESVNLLSSPRIISVDINSGLNGDNGLADICIKSDLTISIGDYMPGLFLNEAKDVIGQLINIDIGIDPVMKPFNLFEMTDAKELLPPRKNMSNKGTYGYIALMGGSRKYSGAITLATMAESAVSLATNANTSMRSGAGVVLVAAPKSLCPLISERILESTVFPLEESDGDVIFDKDKLEELISRVKVITFGMGIGNTKETGKILEFLLSNFKGILIIDADGLNALSDIAKTNSAILRNAVCESVVLTPHVKEFGRLLDPSIPTPARDIQEKPVELAMKYSEENNVITLLKGPSTVVTDGQEVYIVDRGCPGMATAGSGDVLSGVLGAVCGYVKPTIKAVAMGAYINGMAGELAQEEFGDISMVASDTVLNIAKTFKTIRK